MAIIGIIDIMVDIIRDYIWSYFVGVMVDFLGTGDMHVVLSSIVVGKQQVPYYVMGSAYIDSYPRTIS